MRVMKSSLLAGLTIVSLMVVGGCFFNHQQQEIGEVSGDFIHPFRVDSEYGQFNGWFSPEIVYYTSVSNIQNGRFNRVTLLITDNTSVYVQRDGKIQQVPLNFVNRSGRVRAFINRIHREGSEPEVIASRVVFLESE